LGKSCVEVKNDSLAIKYLELSLQKNSAQKEIWSDIGAANMRLKHWEKAADAYVKRIQTDSTYASAYINYALSEMALLRWNLARPALVKAINLQPTYIKGHLYLARCLAQMDSTNSARQAYQKVIELAKAQTQTDYSTELGEAYKMISLAYLVEKNYPKALEALTEAVKYRAEDVELRLWRAQTLHALDKRKEAEEEYQKVLKLDPNNKDAKKGLEILAQYN
jgi:tetratricopeptide (TPR) repeat protein